MRVTSSIALLALLVPLSFNGQSANTAQVNHTAHDPTLPMAVDGAQTPDVIPDDLAYRHFIMAAAENQNASVEEISRRDALLSRVGLSKEDHDYFIIALTNLREQLDEIDRARTELATGSSTSESALDQLRLQQNQILDDARIRLLNSLSLEGATRLGMHIRVRCSPMSRQKLTLNKVENLPLNKSEI